MPLTLRGPSCPALLTMYDWKWLDSQVHACVCVYVCACMCACACMRKRCAYVYMGVRTGKRTSLFSVLNDISYVTHRYASLLSFANYQATQTVLIRPSGKLPGPIRHHVDRRQLHLPQPRSHARSIAACPETSRRVSVHVLLRPGTVSLQKNCSSSTFGSYTVYT